MSLTGMAKGRKGGDRAAVLRHRFGAPVQSSELFSRHNLKCGMRCDEIMRGQAGRGTLYIYYG